MRVKELILYLSKIDGDLDVGVIGNTGQFEHVNEEDIEIRDSFIDEFGERGSCLILARFLIKVRRKN